MEFTKEMYDALLNLIEAQNKKIDLIQKAQADFFEKEMALNDIQETVNNNFNSRMESDLKLIQIHADVLFPLSDATKSNIDAINARISELTNNMAKSVEAMKKGMEGTLAMSKLLTALLTDYSNYINIEGESRRQTYDRIIKSAGLSDSPKGLFIVD